MWFIKKVENYFFCFFCVNYNNIILSSKKKVNKLKKEEVIFVGEKKYKKYNFCGL